MRKLIALSILIIVFVPLAITAMSLISIRPWVLDRGFYERLVSDERLYDALIAGELPNQFNRSVFINADQLPLGALNLALREVVTPDYLRTQALNVVDEVFDFVDGQAENFEVGFDITPIKTALAGAGGVRFANALAAALPACESDQEPIPVGGRLVRCIAANSSVDTAAEQIAGALPAVLQDTPDRIRFNDSINLRTDWGFMDWFRGANLRSWLDFSLFLLIFTTLAAGLVSAFLGGEDLRARLKWLSSSLFFPGSLFVLMGLVMATSLIAGPLRDGLNAAQWSGIQYSESFREAVTVIITPLVQQIGTGFLVTGLVINLIALVLLFWSFAVRRTEAQSGKMVQVPARHA